MSIDIIGRLNRFSIFTLGGVDSTVLLYHLRSQGYDVKTLSVDYGQRHRKELDCARAICRVIGIPHEVAAGLLT